MVSLPDPLNETFSVKERDNDAPCIVNSQGYCFGTYSASDSQIIFYQSKGEVKQLAVKTKDIKGILKCQGKELQMNIVDNRGLIVQAEYIGYPEEDPRSKTCIVIPEEHGGTFQNMELLLNLYPDLKNSFWTDELTGNRYVDMKGLGGEGFCLIPDATVDFRKFIELKSKEIWTRAMNVKKSDAEDQMNRLAIGNKRNPFLEWVMETPPTIEPMPDHITADNFLRSIGASAAELGDDEELFLSEIMKTLLLAVIERQFHPVVVDLTLCLIGPQGTGKTTFCRVLGGEWYRSSSEDVHNIKQFMESANGGVIVEFREGLQVLNPETLKDFLDSDELQYRKPYDKMERKYPVRFVTIITTNDDQPLVDQTGARRIAPIYMQGDVEGAIRPLDIDKENIRRIWHKAYMDYLEGDRWRYHWDKIKGLAEILQESATVSPPYYERVMDALADYPEGSQISCRELDTALVKQVGEIAANTIRKHIKKSPNAYGLKRSSKTFRDSQGKPSKGYVRE